MQFKIEKTEHVNRTFRITKELADTLSEIAQREGISVNLIWKNRMTRKTKT